MIIMMYYSNMFTPEQLKLFPRSTLTHWNKFKHESYDYYELAAPYIKDFDFILLHQASKIVNENIKNNISNNMKIFLDNYDKFGNTVSSSIPLLISKNFKKLKNKKVLLCGFGVGLSIGICDHEF